jgi:hypothetical protein
MTWKPMTWRPITRQVCCAVVLTVSCVVTPARASEDGVAGLETCFQAARRSDVICSNPDNSPEARLDCFQKARAAQLECLDHVPLGVTESAASVAAETISPEKSASQLETGTATVPKPEAAGPLVATAPAVATPLVMVVPAAPAAPTPPSVPPAPAAILATPPSSNWTVSETTSPIDYSPVVIATMRSDANGKDAPHILTAMCRRSRPEITLRTEGGWRPSKTGKVQVLFQVDDKSTASAWTLSADGKTASIPDNAAELLRSLPDDASIKVNVSDGADHGATFQLAGLDIVRRKIAIACRLTPLPETRLSSEKR